jgi:hypothetical protein
MMGHRLVERRTGNSSRGTQPSAVLSLPILRPRACCGAGTAKIYFSLYDRIAGNSHCPIRAELRRRRAERNPQTLPLDEFDARPPAEF